MSLQVGINSYDTVENGDIYFSDRIFSELWTEVIDKDKLLISATQLLDTLCEYGGYPTSSDQLLAFPRDGETDIPQDIKIAMYELAYGILQYGQSSFYPEDATLSQLKAGSVSMTFKDMISNESLVINNIVKSKLRKYGMCNFGDSSINVVKTVR